MSRPPATSQGQDFYTSPFTVLTEWNYVFKMSSPTDNTQTINRDQTTEYNGHWHSYESDTGTTEARARKALVALAEQLGVKDVDELMENHSIEPDVIFGMIAPFECTDCGEVEQGVGLAMLQSDTGAFNLTRLSRVNMVGLVEMIAEGCDDEALQAMMMVLIMESKRRVLAKDKATGFKRPEQPPSEFIEQVIRDLGVDPADVQVTPHGLSITGNAAQDLWQRIRDEVDHGNATGNDDMPTGDALADLLTKLGVDR